MGCKGISDLLLLGLFLLGGFDVALLSRRLLHGPECLVVGERRHFGRMRKLKKLG